MIANERAFHEENTLQRSFFLLIIRVERRLVKERLFYSDSCYWRTSHGRFEVSRGCRWKPKILCEKITKNSRFAARIRTGDQQVGSAGFATVLSG